jgi:hypothetical protein
VASFSLCSDQGISLLTTFEGKLPRTERVGSGLLPPRGGGLVRNQDTFSVLISRTQIIARLWITCGYPVDNLGITWGLHDVSDPVSWGIRVLCAHLGGHFWACVCVFRACSHMCAYGVASWRKSGQFRQFDPPVVTPTPPTYTITCTEIFLEFWAGGVFLGSLGEATLSRIEERSEGFPRFHLPRLTWGFTL